MLFRSSLIVLALVLTQTANAYQSIILVRHAEKQDQSADPGLSSEGQKRAENLARILQNSAVTSIFTSEMKRTQKTAEPLAEKLKLKLNPKKDVAGLVKELQSDTSDGVALVVGHSNTIPEILKALGSSVKVELSEKEFDRMFLLVPRKDQAPVVTNLSY